METKTTTLRSRIAVKPIVLLLAYALVIYAATVSALVVFSLFDAGELALRESAALLLAFAPFILWVALCIVGTHYAVERWLD